MTLQREDQLGLRKVLRTTYQNQFQLVGFKPWLSPYQYVTREAAQKEIENMNFRDTMTVTTLVRQVVVRIPKDAPRKLSFGD